MVRLSNTPEQNPAEHRKALIDSGDVGGMYEHLLTQGIELPCSEVVDALGRCIRRRANTDLSALGENAFAAAIGFATTMLLRAQLHVVRRLQEADQHGGNDLGHIPEDLLDDGWLGRVERISKFVSEMIALRARVQHLNDLGNERQQHDESTRRSKSEPAVDAGSCQVGSGKAVPTNGRCRPGAASAPLAERLGCAIPGA